MGCSQGALSKLAVEPDVSPHTFDDDSEFYDFLYEDIAKRGSIVDPDSITGTRSKWAAFTRESAYLVGGKLATNTSQYDLDLWLPRILGAAESPADNFALSESLPAFGILIDRVGDVFEYEDCYVNRGIWRGRAGPGDGRVQFVEQIVEVLGKDEDATTAWPGTLTVADDLITATNRSPYGCADATLTIGGTPYGMKSFVIMVDNHLQPRWVTGGLTPAAICPAGRTIMLRAVLPFTAADDAVAALYAHANQLTGVAATLVFTSSANHSTTFTFTSLQWTHNSPTVPGKQEITATFDFIARKTAAGTDELVVTNENAA